MRRLVPALLAVLALLVLPLAAMADTCTDCFGGGSPECCAPSCCACCAHAPLATSALTKMEAGAAPVGRAGDAAPACVLPPHFRDVFHVPKPSLA